MRFAVPLALALVATAPSSGQQTPDTPEPTAPAEDTARDDKIRRYLEVSGRAGFAPRLVEQTLAQLDELPVPEGFADAVRKHANPDDLFERLIPLHRELSEETLDAAIAFYETEAGQRLAAVQGQLDADIQRVAGEWLQEVAQTAMQAMGMPTPEENRAQARVSGNEAAALGAMRVVMTAQSLYREGDKDHNDQFDYAHNLAQLGKTGLIDSVLASGEKSGYRFELCAGSEAPEFLWMLVAHPIEPGVSGDRWFVTNQAGVVFYSTEGPFELDRVRCQIPEDATPVGR